MSYIVESSDGLWKAVWKKLVVPNLVGSYYVEDPGSEEAWLHWCNQVHKLTGGRVKVHERNWTEEKGICRVNGVPENETDETAMTWLDFGSEEIAVELALEVCANK